MKEMILKARNEKGFTLAELLIVVAIIAVLVAIAIPVFTGSLNKANAATDLANVRAAYAEKVAGELAKGNTTITVDISNDLQPAVTKGSTVSNDATNHKIKVTLGDQSGEFPYDTDIMVQE